MLAALVSIAESCPASFTNADAFREDVAAMESGMNAHIAKPIELERLYRVLEECLISHDTES